MLNGSENDSPWKETDRLLEEVQRTLDAVGIAAAALAGFESGSGVVGRGVPGRLRSADCERFGAKGFGAAAEREMCGDGCLVEDEEEEEEEGDMYLEEISLGLGFLGGGG